MKSTGAWQVVIQLDPLDTGAEAFTLTAPLAPSSVERKHAVVEILELRISKIRQPMSVAQG